jgi:hypothetical protein
MGCDVRLHVHVPLLAPPVHVSCFSARPRACLLGPLSTLTRTPVRTPVLPAASRGGPGCHLPAARSASRRRLEHTTALRPTLFPERALLFSYPPPCSTPPMPFPTRRRRAAASPPHTPPHRLRCSTAPRIWPAGVGMGLSRRPLEHKAPTPPILFLDRARSSPAHPPRHCSAVPPTGNLPAHRPLVRPSHRPRNL